MSEKEMNEKEINEKRRLAVGVGLAAVVLLAGLAVLVIRNLKTHQSELQQLKQERHT